MRTATTFHQQQQQHWQQHTTTAAKYVGNQKGKAAGKLAEYVNAINLLTGGHCMCMYACVWVCMCVYVCVYCAGHWLRHGERQRKAK